MTAATLTYEDAHRFFQYEPASGLLTWRVSKGTTKAGSVAGHLNNGGYLHVQVEDKKYKVHRIIWLLMTGTFPEAEVDHVSGVRNDNRWSNLRAASHAENGRNVKKPTHNTSGFKGVYWDERTRKWRAKIKLHGTPYYLGYFSTPEDAAEARNGAAALLFGEWERNTK